MWQEALAVFLESYLPVFDLESSTHQFSTGEILAMLAKHTGEDIAIADLTKTLNDRGFKYIRTGDITLEWLMKLNTAD